ncbi:pumilio domain-containing protein P35G2.14-like isoform X1 [Aegilops tauschii subsp. strangulata]|uniref:pumilio domain-containing protein P35G2.14-like isoform X1 n=1 Tax=Aegilops tauschii subsp. strangulata TaxID=200361 RepID=UPI001E1CA27E|nr:pumilio domain-containing protein P35G2.14-like isoform X1 [Aegilops tauschii subsp. strangulata]
MSSDPSSVEPSVAMEVTKPSASPSKESEPVGVRAAAAVAATQVAAHEKNALWVGNLPAHVGEDDVVASFAPHKTLDCVIMRIEYRSNAFIIFRSIAECRTALKALRGSNIKSAFILIEFAQPAVWAEASSSSDICSYFSGGTMDQWRQGGLVENRRWLEAAALRV